MTDSRIVFRKLLAERADLNVDIEIAKKRYLREYEGKPLVFISDHAIIRYIERVLKRSAPDSELGEKDRVAKFLQMNKLQGEEFRNEILPLDEQEFVIKTGVNRYKKGDFMYIFRDYTLVTIITNRLR